MRNLRKLTAVVIAIALVLTSMTAAFAASTTNEFEAQATVLKDLGIFAGDAEGDLLLDQELSRIQGAVLVLKTVLGKTEANQADADTAILSTFDDADKIPAWAEGWMALAVKEGVLVGNDNKLDANGSLYGKQLASMIMNALGFSATNEYAKAVELLAAKTASTLVDAALVTALTDAKLTRDAATAIVFDALTATAKDATQTVIDTFVGTNATLKAIAVKAGLIVVVTGLVVESVKAINTKQVEIKFNADMDKDSSEDEANYIVKSNGISFTTTSLSAIQVDSKTVLITVDEGSVGKMKNSDNATVTVKKDIKPVTATKMAADYVNDKVAVSDGLIPSVVKVEATGEKSLKLTFTEPVYDGTDLSINSNNFSIKSGTYTYFVSGVATADNDAYTISLDVGVKLIEGPITVTVNAAGVDSTDAIRDYAGYKVFKSDVSFTYAKDTTVAIVTVKEAKPGSVTLKFSKAVKGTITLYHSASKVAAYGVTVTKAALADEWLFDYSTKATDYRLPQGTVKLFLVNSNSSDEPIDGYGIKVPEQNLTAVVVVDETAPVVSSSKVNANTSYELTFDEALDPTEAVKVANYTFKKVSDGKDVPFSVGLSSDKKVVTLTAALDDNTQYQVVVKSAKDAAGNKTTAESAYTFTVGDNVNPTVSASYAVGADGKIYITFSEPMNEAQMLDKTNYTVDKTSTGAFVVLGDNDTVTKVSDKRVLIDIDGTVSNPSVRVAAITDLAGKKLGSLALITTVGPIGTESVAIESASLIAKNKVKILFATEIAVFDNLEVSFVPSASTTFTTPVAISGIESQVTNSDGKSEITVVLDRDVATDATYELSTIRIKTAATINNTKSVSGTLLGAGVTSLVISDKVAPEVTKYDADNDNKDVARVVSSLAAGAYAADTLGTITITFSEAMKLQSVSLLTFTVAGYSVETATVSGNLVVLGIKASGANTTGKPNVTQVYNITDANGNVFASGTTWISR